MSQTYERVKMLFRPKPTPHAVKAKIHVAISQLENEMSVLDRQRRVLQRQYDRIHTLLSAGKHVSAREQSDWKMHDRQLTLRQQQMRQRIDAQRTLLMQVDDYAHVEHDIDTRVEVGRLAERVDKKTLSGAKLTELRRTERSQDQVQEKMNVLGQEFTERTEERTKEMMAAQEVQLTEEDIDNDPFASARQVFAENMIRPEVNETADSELTRLRRSVLEKRESLYAASQRVSEKEQ